MRRLLLPAVFLSVFVSSAAGETGYSVVAAWHELGNGLGNLQEPVGIDVDAEGAVFVSDSRNKRILKFAPDGKTALQIGGPSNFKKPVAVSIGRGGRIYAADYDSDRILVFSSSGIYLFGWGESGTGDGEFRSPAGLAIDRLGQVYVADFYNNRIQVFNAEGLWMRSIGAKGRGKGKFNYPTDVAVDSDGSLLIADAYNHRIQKLSRRGKVLAVWGSRWSRFFGKRNAFKVPSGVAVDDRGLVYVADSGNARVVALRPDGTIKAEWRIPGSGTVDVYSPTRLAASKGGTLYAADTARNRILILKPGGKESAASHVAADTRTKRATKGGDIVIRIEGMACPFCAYGIEKHLGRLSGVASARVNLGESTAVLHLVPGAKVSPENIQRAVKKAGFKASEVKHIEAADK